MELFKRLVRPVLGHAREFGTESVNSNIREIRRLGFEHDRHQHEADIEQQVPRAELAEGHDMPDLL